MKTFDAKWRRMAGHAHRPDARDETAPHGFAARVVALARAGNGPTVEDLWLSLLRRTLMAGTAVLVVVAILELADSRPSPLGRSGVENVVAQLLWTL